MAKIHVMVNAETVYMDHYIDTEEHLVFWRCLCRLYCTL